MKTAEPAVPSTVASESTPGGGKKWEPTPWLLGFLCFLIPALPTFVVLPGPLKSNGSPARMISVLMFGLVILGYLMIRRTGPIRRVNPGTVIMLSYFLLLLLTYGVGLTNHDSYLTATNRTRALITLISHVGVGLYVFARVRTTRDRNIVIACLAAGLTFACLVGALQGIANLDLRLLLQPPGFVLNTEDLDLAQRLGATRVTGTSQHAIEFSVLAAVTIPLTMYLARHSASKNARMLWALACGIAIIAMPAAISRTGVIALAAALLVYMFAFKVRPIAIALVTGAIAVAGYSFAFPNIVNALWNTIIGSGDDTSIQGRTADYATVSEIFREHPLFGMGLGGQPDLLDNEWLQAVVQGGVVGLVAMALISGGAILGMAAALRTATTPREREQAYMLGAMTIGILTSSATFDLFFYQQPTLIFFMVFALMWRPFTVDVPDPNLDSAHRTRWRIPFIG